MSIPKIVTGDDLSLSVTLKKNGSTFTINPGAAVKAAIVSEDRVVKHTDDIVQSSGATGADWANSLVIVDIPSTETIKVNKYGKAVVEIQVNDGGKRTWFATVTVVKGNIS